MTMRKQWIRIAALGSVITLPGMCLAAGVSGNWVATTGNAPTLQYTRVSLAEDGGKLTGMWGTSKVDGKLTDGNVEMKLSDPQGNPAGELSGTISGETI